MVPPINDDIKNLLTARINSPKILIYSPSQNQPFYYNSMISSYMLLIIYIKIKKSNLASKVYSTLTEVYIFSPGHDNGYSLE